MQQWMMWEAPHEGVSEPIRDSYYLNGFSFSRRVRMSETTLQWWTLGHAEIWGNCPGYLLLSPGGDLDLPERLCRGDAHWTIRDATMAGSVLKESFPKDLRRRGDKGRLRMGAPRGERTSPRSVGIARGRRGASVLRENNPRFQQPEGYSSWELLGVSIHRRVQ